MVSGNIFSYEDRSKDAINLYYEDWISTSTLEKNRILDVYFKIIKNLQILLGDREAPNNQTKCVNFYLNKFTLYSSTWTLTENHDDNIGCEGAPSTEPRITDVIATYYSSSNIKINFEKWCEVVDQRGKRDLLPIIISLSDNPSGSCPKS